MSLPALSSPEISPLEISGALDALFGEPHRRHLASQEWAVREAALKTAADRLREAATALPEAGVALGEGGEGRIGGMDPTGKVPSSAQHSRNVNVLKKALGLC